MLKRALIVPALVLALVSLTAQAWAQTANSSKSEEYLLLGNATRGAGEPMLAVDPVDPQSIIVSHALSPMRYRERDDGWFGDDVQDMVIDGGNAYLVWGDSRAGFLGTWLGKVALSSYQFPADARSR